MRIFTSPRLIRPPTEAVMLFLGLSLDWKHRLPLKKKGLHACKYSHCAQHANFMSTVHLLLNDIHMITHVNKDCAQRSGSKWSVQMRNGIIFWGKWLAPTCQEVINLVTWMSIRIYVVATNFWSRIGCSHWAKFTHICVRFLFIKNATSTTHAICNMYFHCSIFLLQLRDCDSAAVNVKVSSLWSSSPWAS